MYHIARCKAKCMRLSVFVFVGEREVEIEKCSRISHSMRLYIYQHTYTHLIHNELHLLFIPFQFVLRCLHLLPFFARSKRQLDKPLVNCFSHPFTFACCCIMFSATPVLGSIFLCIVQGYLSSTPESDRKN